jgi:hypothetical protein
MNRFTSAVVAILVCLCLCLAPITRAQSVTTSAARSQCPPSCTPALSPITPLLLDDDDDDKKPSQATTTSVESGRYFFGLLDHRSMYGRDFFPDSFLGPEFDAERQIDFNYLHGERRGMRDDELDGGFQWNVAGELTISAEAGWDSQRSALIPQAGDGASEDTRGGTGAENVDLAVYHPIFQLVSDNGFLDYTAAARLDFGIPTRSHASGTDLQLAPYLGQLLRVGDHISLQAWTGSQITIAHDQANQFIYGLAAGYAIDHDDLPVPFVEKITPLLECDGQSPLKSGSQDVLFGVAGVNLSFNAIGEAQPQLQIGYQFPLDQGARDQDQWAILTQIFLEF